MNVVSVTCLMAIWPELGAFFGKHMGNSGTKKCDLQNNPGTYGLMGVFFPFCMFNIDGNC
jgi:hypothetical protein